jgi:hypothetical protein
LLLGPCGQDRGVPAIVIRFRVIAARTRRRRRIAAIAAGSLRIRRTRRPRRSIGGTATGPVAR